MTVQVRSGSRWTKIAEFQVILSSLSAPQLSVDQIKSQVDSDHSPLLYLQYRAVHSYEEIKISWDIS